MKDVDEIRGEAEEKELSVKMNFYLTMNKGETKEQAIKRFNRIMNSLDSSTEEWEGSTQIHEYKIQEY